MIKIKYYGKITDPKDLVTAEYVNENGGKIDSIEVDGVEQPIVDKTVSITGFAAINEKIPAQASSSNQLADKNFVNSSIENVAAYYITKDAAGNPFATKAELTAATTFYSGGQVRVPTRNDYCVVLADESKTITETGENPTTRYLYDDNTWSYQYIVNRSGLTAAQWATLNSGIIAADKTNWDAKYTKPSGGIPDSDIASAATWNAKYTKPAGGIPNSDIAGISGSKVSGAVAEANSVALSDGYKMVMSWDGYNYMASMSNGSNTRNIATQIGVYALYSLQGGSNNNPVLRNEGLAASDTVPTNNGEICWTYQ